MNSVVCQSQTGLVPDLDVVYLRDFFVSRPYHPQISIFTIMRKQRKLLPTFVLMLLATPSLASIACSKKHDLPPPCAPEDITWSLQLAIQPNESMNLDSEGAPLPTQLRIYQLASDLTLNHLDFHEVWQDAKVAFGKDYLSEEEFTVFPGQNLVRQLKPNPEATHILAVAIFREPMGRTWFRSYEIPRDYGQAVCDHGGSSPGNPCFYILIDRNQVNGGASPPPGFKRDSNDWQCPPPIHPKPKAQAPAEPKGKKRKKRKKFDRKKADPSKVPTEKPTPPQQPKVPSKPI